MEPEADSEEDDASAQGLPRREAHAVRCRMWGRGGVGGGGEGVGSGLPPPLVQLCTSGWTQKAPPPGKLSLTPCWGQSKGRLLLAQPLCMAL